MIGVAAVFLGLVHGLIGGSEQFIRGVPALRMRRNTDTWCGVHLATIQFERLSQFLDDLARDSRSVGIRRQILEQHRKLVAAETADDIADPKALTQTLADTCKQPVADRVTEGIVNFLKAVEVEKEKRQHAGAVVGTPDRPSQQIEKHLAIGHAGETVVLRHVSEFLRHRRGVTGFVQHQHRPVETALAVVQWHAADRH